MLTGSVESRYGGELEGFAVCAVELTNMERRTVKIRILRSNWHEHSSSRMHSFGSSGSTIETQIALEYIIVNVHASWILGIALSDTATQNSNKIKCTKCPTSHQKDYSGKTGPADEADEEGKTRYSLDCRTGQRLDRNCGSRPAWTGRK